MQALIDAIRDYKNTKEFLKEAVEEHANDRISDAELKRQTTRCEDAWEKVVNVLERCNG